MLAGISCQDRDMNRRAGAWQVRGGAESKPSATDPPRWGWGAAAVCGSGCPILGYVHSGQPEASLGYRVFRWSLGFGCALSSTLRLPGGVS